jgi:hypothetical protein
MHRRLPIKRRIAGRRMQPLLQKMKNLLMEIMRQDESGRVLLL